MRRAQRLCLFLGNQRWLSIWRLSSSRLLHFLGPEARSSATVSAGLLLVCDHAQYPRAHLSLCDHGIRPSLAIEMDRLGHRHVRRGEEHRRPGQNNDTERRTRPDRIHLLGQDGHSHPGQIISPHRRIGHAVSLLQNVMTFKKCSIRGQLFGYVFDEHGNDISDVNERPNEKRSSNVTEGGEDFPWPDETLIEALKSDNEDVNRFFTLLSLCHTVMPEERNGQLFYQAQSPDENALVSAAQAFGYAFQVNRRPAPFSFIPFLFRIELRIRSPLLDETRRRSSSIC